MSICRPLLVEVFFFLFMKGSFQVIVILVVHTSGAYTPVYAVCDMVAFSQIMHISVFNGGWMVLQRQRGTHFLISGF